MTDAGRESVRRRAWRYERALRRLRSQLDRPCHDGVDDILATALVAFIDKELEDEPAEADAESA